MLRYPALLLTALAAISATAVADLEIEAPDEVADNIRAHLSLSKEPCDAPQWRIKRLFSRVEQELEPAVRALGYYRPSVEKQLSFGDACWRVGIVVDVGERVRVKDVALEIVGAADADPAFKRLRRELSVKPGDPLHHGRYEAIKGQLRDLALERGYFDAAFATNELRVNPGEGTAVIFLRFESGNRYRFGPLKLSEQPLAEDFVRRLAALDEGAYYDARKLVTLDRNLSNAGYFGGVEVSPRRAAARDYAIPVDVKLTALPRHAWRAGIGYATDSGPRFSFGYQNRFVNRHGHRFGSEMRLSTVESGLTFDYMLPGENPHKWQFDLSLGVLHEETDSSESDSVKMAIRQTFHHKKWTETRFVELLHERSTIGDETTTATLLMPGWSLAKTYSDNPLRTRRGYRLGFEVRGAYQGLLSTATFVQVRAHAKGIHRFGGGGRVTGRVELGSTWADVFTELPASLRFFAGGDNSVRGYAYESLGPTDDDGDPQGGHNLLTGSLEYEHPIHGEDWWAAAFVDAGNAYDNSDFTTRYGYGVGLRWYSPVGRLRLDVAVPDDTSDDDWRIHFGLGADL